MAIARKQYTREFKHEAVRLVAEQGVSLAQASRDLELREPGLSLKEGTDPARISGVSRMWSRSRT